MAFHNMLYRTVCHMSRVGECKECNDFKVKFKYNSKRYCLNVLCHMCQIGDFNLILHDILMV